MSKNRVALAGLFAALALSWAVSVLIPLMQLGAMQQTVPVGEESRYPRQRSGLAKKGAEVYRANGCNACHTQQLGPAQTSSDIARGWGRRRSVAYDYLFDYPVMTGSQRIGPDLANIGMRMDSETLLRRLHHPQALVRGSLMPPYRFLFEKVDAGHVPGPDALALVAYLRSLRTEGVLYQTPPALSAKPRPKGSTSLASQLSLGASEATNAAVTNEVKTAKAGSTNGQTSAPALPVLGTNFTPNAFE